MGTQFGVQILDQIMFRETLVQIVVLIFLSSLDSGMSEDWWTKDETRIIESGQSGSGWTEGDSLISFCPDTNGKPEGKYAYGDECSKYVECRYGTFTWPKAVRNDTKKPQKINSGTNKGHWNYLVTLASCPFCAEDEPTCPNGTTQVFHRTLRKCINPGTATKEEDQCGTQGKEKLCQGPPDSNDVHRLGNTTFYLLQNEEKTNLVNWHEAKEACEKLGLKLAKIDSFQTEILVRKQLEKFILPRGWIDNWYWLDAKFDRTLQTYVWQDTMKPLNFSNFHYRPPRPKGYGDFFDNDGNYIPEPEAEYCLTQSMPLRFPNSIEPDYREFHTSWWERDCDNRKKGNVLCESADKNQQRYCDTLRADSLYTQNNGPFFEGFWPMSNRRFIVNWIPKSYDEAKALCEEYKMKLYQPDEADGCLSQNLKNWMKAITSYSFWTDVKYKTEERVFVYANGTEVAEGAREFRTRKNKREASDGIPETCASITWNSEDFPANPNFCNCTVNSVVLTPENCKNRIGVICQPQVEELGECTTAYFEKPGPASGYMSFVVKENEKKREIKKIDEHYPFNDDPNWKGGIIRSAYKQDGMAGQCPPDYVRVTVDDEYWGTEADFENSNHTYDFLTPYWMKPQHWVCKLSVVKYEDNKLTRELTTRDCSKWLGFILCKKKLGAGRYTEISGRSFRNHATIDEPLSVSDPV